MIRRVFLCEKDYFHYLTFFEDLDGFDVINRQGKIVCFVSFSSVGGV